MLATPGRDGTPGGDGTPRRSIKANPGGGLFVVPVGGAFVRLGGEPLSCADVVFAAGES